MYKFDFNTVTIPIIATHYVLLKIRRTRENPDTEFQSENLLLYSVVGLR